MRDVLAQAVDTALAWFRGILHERDLWIAIVGAVLIGMGAAAAKLPQLVLHRASRRIIRVKVIRSKKDPDLQAFLAIYEARIEAPFRVANDDIITWVTSSRRAARDREDVTLLAKHDGQPIAILKAIIGRREKIAFIAYLATAMPMAGSEVVPSMVWRQGVAELTAWLSRHLRRRHCTAVIFEVPADRNAARMKLFREYGTLHGLKCCRVEMAYLQPKMDPKDRGTERKMTLVYVSLAKMGAGLSCSLDEAAEMLRFVYFTVYASTHAARHSQQETREYSDYLDLLLARQISQLPGQVTMCTL